MSRPPEDLRYTPYQKFVVAVLAFLQFTIVLDFMIISPLGAALIPALQITPSQFGLVVSAYAFCAGASGFLAAGFADRYDRKTLLLVFYAGFIFGTALCAAATTFSFLLFARMVTGMFAGVIGAIVFAITADLFPYAMRGRVMGVVQTAFAASQVLGIPLGLFISNLWGWNATFWMIVAVSLAVGVILVVYLKPIDEHLKTRVDRSAFHHMLQTVSDDDYLRGFAATAFLSIGGYMLPPFLSAYTVNNLGVPLKSLPMVYMATGMSSLIAGPLIGRLADRIGKLRTFIFGGMITIPMVVLFTNMGPTSIGWVMLVMAALFVGITARIVAAGAIVSAVPRPADRGAYMSISSSLQQVSGGAAAVIAGMIVSQTDTGRILHFDVAGYCVVGTTLVSMFLMYRINRESGLPS